MFRKKECSHVATGWNGDAPYVYMKDFVIDGIDRIHGDMYATCDKCGEEFLMCKTHLDHAIMKLAKSERFRFKILEETKYHFLLKKPLA